MAPYMRQDPGDHLQQNRTFFLQRFAGGRNKQSQVGGLGRGFWHCLCKAGGKANCRRLGSWLLREAEVAVEEAPKVSSPTYKYLKKLPLRNCLQRHRLLGYPSRTKPSLRRLLGSIAASFAVQGNLTAQSDDIVHRTGALGAYLPLRG